LICKAKERIICNNEISQDSNTPSFDFEPVFVRIQTRGTWFIGLTDLISDTETRDRSNLEDGAKFARRGRNLRKANEPRPDLNGQATWPFRGGGADAPLLSIHGDGAGVISVMAIGAGFVRGITISRCLSLCSSVGRRNGVYWPVETSQMSEVFWAYDTLPYYQGRDIWIADFQLPADRDRCWLL
jgi:hypothetical protein